MTPHHYLFVMNDRLVQSYPGYVAYCRNHVSTCALDSTPTVSVDGQVAWFLV